MNDLCFYVVCHIFKNYINKIQSNNSEHNMQLGTFIDYVNYRGKPRIDTMILSTNISVEMLSNDVAKNINIMQYNHRVFVRSLKI